MKNWKILLIAALSVLLLILIFQNTEPVETKFLMVSVTLPRAALLLVTGLVSFTIGLLVALRLSGRKSEPKAES